MPDQAGAADGAPPAIHVRGRFRQHRSDAGDLVVVRIVAWSAMTLLCRLATNFWTVFAARMGVGMGKACLAPAAYSLIADYTRIGLDKHQSRTACGHSLGREVECVL
jgi:MFS family permease